jgi:hypothetical protein
MNQLVREMMIETIRQAREMSRIADAVQHDGLRGQFRESFLARALRPWLPQGVELGTGVIIDEKGTLREVNEDDIIIYAPDLLPAVLPIEERNVFLLDAVIACIEVKSTLSSRELKSAVEGAISVKKLVSSFRGTREIHAVFAYQSTAVVRSELDRLEEQTINLGWNETIPPISIICVDEKECYMHGRIGDKSGKWFDLAPGAPEDSTLAFISCMASFVTEIRDSRETVQIGRFSYDFSKAKEIK